MLYFIEYQIKLYKNSSHRNLNGMFRLHIFFFKQPVYKQLAVGWQIANNFQSSTLFH